MLNFKWIILLVLILLPNVAYGERFTSQTYKFKIDYPPEKWFLYQTNQQTVKNIIPITTLVSNQDQPYPANLNILIERSDSDLQSYFNTNKEEIVKFYGPLHLSIQSQGNTTINGNKSLFMEFTWLQPQNNTAPLKIVSKQYIFQKDSVFYLLTYTHPQSSIKNSLLDFDDISSTFEFLDQNQSADKFTTLSKPQAVPYGGRCLIATATYGSEMAPQVQMLREVRDGILLHTNSGTAFMNAFNKFYYSFSPTIADWERENEVFKQIIKIIITPLIATLSILTYVDIDSEAKVVTYGISVILLNIGIYFVLPAVVILKIKRLTDHNKNNLSKK